MLVKAFAQVDQASRIGGIETSREVDRTTWREIAQDPWGEIEGMQGTRGLVYNVACG
ncbi:MAG: hypothetical protein R3185_05455 [Candidatus Thermoplasmatota archaeon]|nr:hypothetical protein [Candidatus Thermoplasmatota archaeon]